MASSKAAQKVDLRAAPGEARRLGSTPYELFEEIGRGGLGVVYAARDTRSGQRVAIKLLERRATYVDERAIEHFCEEAAIMARLKSRHVVQVLDHDTTDDGLPFTVMELLEGEDLEQRLSGGRRLDALRAITLGLQLCEALEAAHAHGFIHGDIKPSNIFLCDRSSRPELAEAAVLLDFGASPSRPCGTEGAQIGTPAYMAPEQADGRLGAVDAPTDVYALGLVLFRCITGVLPFCGEALAQVFQRIHDDAPPLTWRANHVCPSIIALASVIDHALRRRPEQRFASVAAFSRALDAAGQRLAGCRCRAVQPAHRPIDAC